MSGFLDRYEEYRAAFEAYLQARCADMRSCPAVLAESMRYSLLSGGKRVRPVLFLAALHAYACDWRRELCPAFALECIHTYSLIHDDLPAMDNDDFRRGKPSSHKAFGEGNAILAGDALLSYAFDLLIEVSAGGERYRRAAAALSFAAGAEGMIAGQSADLNWAGNAPDPDALSFIYRNKTGRLIAAPLVMAAEIAQRDSAAAEAFGLALGDLFQMTDDILDETSDRATLGKTPGKDREEDKLTCVKVLGLQGACAAADQKTRECLALADAAYAKSQFFADFVQMVRNRIA